MATLGDAETPGPVGIQINTNFRTLRQFSRISHSGRSNESVIVLCECILQLEKITDFLTLAPDTMQPAEIIDSITSPRLPG